MKWSENDVVLGVSLGVVTVGVVRMRDGMLLFPGEVDVGGGVVLTDFTPHGTTVDGRTVVAGRRLPGVARVVVIDDRGDEYEARLGDEVWVAVAGQAAFSEPLARYEDADGGLVPYPLPDGERAPVEDADAPCPICESRSWLEIGERVHCARCGLQVGAGLIFMRLEVPDEELVEEDEEAEEDWEAEERREREEALASATFPIYGVPGREHEISGWSSSKRKGVHGVTVEHVDGEQRLQVKSSIKERWEDDDRLREQLAAMTGRHEYVDRSDAGLRVHHTDADRASRRRAARAERQTRTFIIDGEPEPFELLALDDHWVAEREHYGVTVSLTATGVDPGTVQLAPVAGPASTAEHGRRAAAGDLLTRAEVLALIDEHDAGDRREEILAGIRPGYRLTPDRKGPHRTGGQPDLAPGEQWPHDEDGIPYTFVAQIDCSRLPPIESDFPVPEFNHGGRLLRFFTPLDAHVPEPNVAVALACSPDAPLTRTPVPPRPDPMPEDVWEPDDDSLRELDEQRVRLTPFLSLSDARYDDEFAAALVAGGVAPRQAREWGTAESQLFGHTTNVQGEDPSPMGQYVYEGTDGDAWCLLLHIPSGEALDLGDGGDLSILIRYEDLAAGRFDRLATDISMG